ncbi:MAG: cupin domain-containing protein [Acidimicrobiales bacterium]|jgi:mannose-6-phosphate isomerase-like protein (cupin superfamily)
MQVRRVVTGHDHEGNAVFVSDEMVLPVTPTLTPGTEFHLLWGADSASSFPDDGSKPQTELYFPPIDGFRFAFFTLPPNRDGDMPHIDTAAAQEEFRSKLPGLAEYLDAEHPGMHTTATIDFGVVISGEAVLELDDKEKVTLRMGDTYVQNGTRHRWSNKGDVPFVIAVILIGAHHSKVP